MATTVDKVMVEARAAELAKRSVKGESKLRALRLAMSMLDLTTLEGKDTPEKVRSLCRKAVRPAPAGEGAEALEDVPSVAAVCVYPSMVKVAKAELARCGGERINVASVATGFPSGQYALSIRIADTRKAVADGADEIDMVINRGAFLAGRYKEVAQEIREVHAACKRHGGGDGGRGGHAHLKVILETGELETYDNVRRASDLAIEAMADSSGDCRGGFIKTSTGKVQPAATLPVTLVMLEAIRDHYLATGHKVGMKPAGGISTAKVAIQYLCMVKETLGVLDGGEGEGGWLTPEWFRFGASSLANDLLRQMRWLKTGKYAARYDYSEA